VNSIPGAKVPIPTLERLATYLRYLIDLEAAQIETISSTEVEQQTGINAAQFRKDLSYFGEFGKPGVGYNVVELQTRIARILRMDRDQQVIVLGGGNLGSALVGYRGLWEGRFHIIGVFDDSEQKIGTQIWGQEIQDVRRLREWNVKHGVKIAIIAVPASAAQAVAEEAVLAGVRALLNFAPTILKVPPRVVVRNVSFLQELAVLSYRLAVDARK
jgi:redox-sensing transcriptional repressor